ncbi:UNVERIFIED_CONTAM: hypothetical protein FKN15_017274 [Acipenser sinensis]
MAVVPVGLLAIFLPAVWTCPPQKADFVMVSCFPNAIIANVLECPYGWEMNQLSLGGVCYSGINSPGYFRFAIPDLTPKNNSYCGTQSEYVGGKEPKYIFYNSIVSNDTSLTIRNQPVNYSFSCSYKASYLVNSAVFSQRVATVYINNGSVGSFRSQLSMNVFTNSKFLHTKDAPYTIDTSDIGSEVFIGIEAKGLSSRTFLFFALAFQYVGGKEPKYIFYNSIVSNDTSLTIRNQPVNYSFSCSYKASYLVNSAVFSQRVATVYINNGSVGSFRSQLSMNVFTNSKFLHTKDAPYTIDTSDIGSEVFIGIEAKGLSSSCSVDNTATIFENGKDSRSMFKFNSFRFQLMEKVSTVWLHCQVQICDSEKRTCQPTHPCTVRSQNTDPEGGVLSAEFQLKDSPVLSLLGFLTLFVSLYTPLL